MECDGAVYGSSDVFEKEAMEATTKAFKYKTAVAPGPFAFPVAELPNDTSPTGKEVEAFLQKAVEAKGEKSVLYVRAENTSNCHRLRFVADIYGQCVLDGRAREILGSPRCASREKDLFRTHALSRVICRLIDFVALCSRFALYDNAGRSESETGRF